uniref:CHCH domain-containing protein n=1 Tax=Cuerna arida TaxID=1464854 RepID=A0A1B6GRK2_9HEMI
MGGSQSTRKIGIDNDETVGGVIRVSENVAQRLKNINNVRGGENASTTFSNPQPISPSPVSGPIVSQQPSSGFYAPQPFITSSMIRDQIEKELEKNDRYWERRIKTLQDNQNRITQVMESEFNKAYKEIENNFPTLAPKDATIPCQDYKSMVVDCFKNNANHTLNCSKLVNDFAACVSNSRTKRHNENRSP